MEEEKWKRLDGSSVVFDGEGRMKMLATCKCGATAWVRQGKIFKRFFTGRCPSCGAFLLARVKRVRVEAVEGEDGEYRIRDVDLLTAHLVDVAIRTVDPVLYDAALMLTELHEKHWDECLQIGKYSEAERILTKCVLAAGKDEGNADPSGVGEYLCWLRERRRGRGLREVSYLRDIAERMSLQV